MSGNTRSAARDDDSLNAATVAINDAQTRIQTIEDTLKSPHQLGQLIVASIEKSVELRAQLSNTTLELLDNYDNRKALEKIISKIDRKWWNRAWKKGLGVAGAVLLVIVGAFLQAYFS